MRLCLAVNNMNNIEVNGILEACREELKSINSLIVGLGGGAVPDYIQRYAVIRATGTIETGFKTIIADKVDEDSHIQVKNFIQKKIRKSSCNPSLGQIENMLTEFDERWKSKFDELLALEDRPGLKGALSELVNTRNGFAHGGVTSLNIQTIIQHFESGIKVLRILDSVVNHDFDGD